MEKVHMGISLLGLCVILLFVGVSFIGSVQQELSQNTTDSQQANQVDLTPVQQMTHNIGVIFLIGAAISGILGFVVIKL